MVKYCRVLRTLGKKARMTLVTAGNVELSSAGAGGQTHKQLIFNIQKASSKVNIELNHRVHRCHKASADCRDNQCNA